MDIALLRARTGDTIFVRVPPHREISIEQAETLRKRIQECVPEGVKICILTEGFEIIHLSMEDSGLNWPPGRSTKSPTT
jgi:hypothetical protein